MAQVKIYGIGITVEQEQVGFKESLEMDDASARKLFGIEKKKYRDELKEKFYQKTGIQPITLELKAFYHKESFEFEDSAILQNFQDSSNSFG